MRTDTPLTIRLADYRPTSFILSHVELDIDVHPAATRISSRLHLAPREGGGEALELDGEGLDLISLAIDGQRLEAASYSYDRNKLVIPDCPQRPFILSIEQCCNPEANTALSGLYLSSGIYCTQMEAEGFRRMAFCYDRPDAMATYEVRIEAPRSLPVLLSNGNPVGGGVITGTDRHYALWHDPHPKPTYLFAMVAGDLASVHDSFVTAEDRDVSLGIYVERGKEDRCDWAMQSLKASMLWEEQRFGRCYDLDVFNIVAVSDFNMGAMENKGLNIFNDKFILARPDTATDADYINIERIIAHEYFHNWTGNRITCRDWFQLCLKEGLTVFRDQEFTSDLRSRGVKRIEDVKTLRARQFPEDQGPLAHAVRPASYIEINNFYTPTIYEKGAEICRMIHTLLGADAFRQGMDLYFKRHDGEAATVEDFLCCMADASHRDLAQFSLWYEQAGTPVVTVAASHDAKANTFTLTLRQQTPPTPGQDEKLPLHMPLQLALYDDAGHALVEQLVELRDSEMQLKFDGIAEVPHVSVNRGFTAPVILRTEATSASLLKLLVHDTDPFNRWEASQTLARRLLIATYRDESRAEEIEALAEGLGNSLENPSLDDAYKSLLLQLPGEAEITAELARNVDASRVRLSRENLVTAVAGKLSPRLMALINSTHESGAYRPDPASTGRRALRHAALTLLARCDPDAAVDVALRDFNSASSMTAKIGALSSVLNCNHAGVNHMLDAFHAAHAGDHLLVDKWFMLQGSRVLPDAAAHVEALTRHPAFSFRTPNRVYALLGGFHGGNPTGFHAADGTGYRFVSETICLLDGLNPQVASRMATAFRSWRQYDDVRMFHARAAMQRILQQNGLSNDVFEIITRTMA